MKKVLLLILFLLFALSSFASTSDCYITCNVQVICDGAYVQPGQPVTFQVSVEQHGDDCPPSTIQMSWNFGDGGCIHKTKNFTVVHTFQDPGDFFWTLSVKKDNEYCSESGNISVCDPNAIDLLRYNGVTNLDPLTPSADVIFPLTITRDLEAYDYQSGDTWNNDQFDLTPDAPKLVFYRVTVPGNSLRVTVDKSSGTPTIKITY